MNKYHNSDSEFKQNSIYFSYFYKFKAKKTFIKNIFKQDYDEKSIALYSDCQVSVVTTPDNENEIRVIVRRIDCNYSTFRKRCVKIRHMIGFDIKEIPEIFDESTKELVSTPCPGSKNTPRWILKLSSHNNENDSVDYFLWEYAQDGMNINQSKIYEIFNDLKQKISHPDTSKKNIFDLSINKDIFEMIPVIYQPAFDVWKNFLRSVDCYPIKSQNEHIYEITLVFNDERLREHGIFDAIYRIIRFIRYGRIMDVEKFKIITKNNNVDFDFTGIYSGDHNLLNDNIHEDCPCEKRKRCEVKYFFANKSHPIVFINTSNHAMAEHDTNNNLWKWEYRPWEDDSPVLFGHRSYSEIIKNFRKNWWKLEPILYKN